METKFDSFKREKDTASLYKLDGTEYARVDEPVELVQVTGLLSDEEADKLHEEIVIHAGSSFAGGEIKRGQTIYLTALFRTPGQVYTANQQGVIQCRISDIFIGLSKLNSLMKK